MDARRGSARRAGGALWRAAALALAQHGLTAPAAGQTQGPIGPPDAETASPAPQPPPRHLRVALFNIRDAAGVGAIPSPVPVRAAYRHTFGAERRTAPLAQGQGLDPAAWSADVVLIQGSTDLRETRKLFPARGWKLVVTRLPPELLAAPPGGEPVPTTAIAVRHRIGLRITRQELRLEAGAGTAARLLVAGAPVWLLSAAPLTQPRAAAIESWLDAKHALGEQTVVGGSLPATLPRDRGGAVPLAPKADGAEPPAMPALLAGGERRLVGGRHRSHARFPDASEPKPCGAAAGDHAIVVDQRIASRMAPDSGGWIVPLRRPGPAAADTPAAAPLSASQIRAGSQARPAAAPSPAAQQPEACIFILDLGV